MFFFLSFSFFPKNSKIVLDFSPDWYGSVGWVSSANRMVSSSIPGQDTSLGCGLGPWLGVCERQLIDVSLAHWCFPFLSFSSPSPLSLKKKRNLKKKLLLRYNNWLWMITCGSWHSLTIALLMACFLCRFFYSLIEIHFTSHKIYPFNVHCSVVLYIPWSSTTITSNF